MKISTGYNMKKFLQQKAALSGHLSNEYVINLNKQNDLITSGTKSPMRGGLSLIREHQ